MMIGKRVLATCAILLAATLAAGADEAKPESSSPYAQWKNGPSKDDSYFPIAVWCQEPSMAPEYQKAGINLYFSLWEGPTEAQLAELKKDGMQVVCGQNAAGLAHIDDPTIVGWMHGDEPDNAQSGTGSPVPPAKIVEEYEAIRKADPSRPVFVNFGRGVAWDGWKGRGTRNNHPEDFAEYIKGCDIASFDIYPVANMPANLRGQLDFVGHGVERLVKWCDGGKFAWNALECTRIHGEDKPTPKQVRTEVWMSLVKGSRGIIYFVHQFLPKFDEHALLDDPEMLAAVTAINGQIKRLAPVLNSPTIPDGVKVESSNKDVPLATMVKKQGGATYVFAVAMKAGETDATFTLDGLVADAQVRVLGERRSIEPADGKIRDHFGDWDVHIYRIR
jgi:hypothetical protein